MLNTCTTHHGHRLSLHQERLIRKGQWLVHRRLEPREVLTLRKAGSPEGTSDTTLLEPCVWRLTKANVLSLVTCLVTVTVMLTRRLINISSALMQYVSGFCTLAPLGVHD